MAVAQAAGVTLSITDPRRAWTMAAEGLPPEFKTSMLQSLEKAPSPRSTYINGAVVRWGANAQRADAGQLDAGRVHQGHRARRSDYPGKA